MSVLSRLSVAIRKIISLDGNHPHIAIYYSGKVVNAVFKDLSSDDFPKDNFDLSINPEGYQYKSSFHIPVVNGIHFAANLHGRIHPEQRRINDDEINNGLRLLFIKAPIMKTIFNDSLSSKLPLKQSTVSYKPSEEELKKKIKEYKQEYYQKNKKKKLREKSRQNYHQKNKKKLREKSRQNYHQNKPEKIKYQKEYKQEYYQKNKKKLREKSRQNYHQNKPEKIKYQKKYNKANQEKKKNMTENIIIQN